MRGVRNYVIEVDIHAPRKITYGSLQLIGKHREGDHYQNMPFHGTLIAAPDNSEIPVGETVYLHYHAIDTLTDLEGKYCYVVDDDKIVAYGEDMKAYKGVMVKPKTEKLESSVIEIVQYETPDAVSGTVLSSGVDFLEDGDEIEYENNVDWSFFIGMEEYFFIKWTHKIIKRNGEFVEGWAEAEHAPRYKSVNGVELPTYDRKVKMLSGQYKDKWVILEHQKLVNKKYVPEERIIAVLSDDIGAVYM